MSKMDESYYVQFSEFGKDFVVNIKNKNFLATQYIVVLWRRHRVGQPD